MHCVRAVVAHDFNRHDFALEMTGIHRSGCLALTLETECIERVFAEAVFFRNHFRAGELIESNSRVAPINAGAFVIAKSVLFWQR